MRHVHASRHVHPIAGSLLALALVTGCGGDGWPDGATVDGTMVTWCAANNTAVEPTACQAAWAAGYIAMRDSIRAGRPLTVQEVNTASSAAGGLTESVAWLNGARYAESVAP